MFVRRCRRQRRSGACVRRCVRHDETEKRRDLKTTVFIYRFSSATARSSALAFASHIHHPAAFSSTANFMCVRVIHFRKKGGRSHMCIKGESRWNTTKVFVAQNFLVFPETCRGAGCGVDVGRSSDDVVYCEPTNPPMLVRWML